MSDLNAKMNSDKIPFGHMMGKHADRNGNDGFVQLLLPRHWWNIVGGQSPLYGQLGLLDVHKKEALTERDHYLMAAFVRLCAASATSDRVRDPRTPPVLYPSFLINLYLSSIC